MASGEATPKEMGSPDGASTFFTDPPVVAEVLITEDPGPGLQIVFSRPMQIDAKILDETIVNAVSLVHYRNGVVPMEAADFTYVPLTQSLLWASDWRLPPGAYELQVHGAQLQDVDGNLLRGGSNEIEFHLPAFAAEIQIQDNGQPLTAENYSVPSMADWDGDGVFDLIVGQETPEGGKIRVYLNQGTATAPQFDGFSYVKVNNQDLTVPCQGCLGVFPRLADWNRDGKQDLVLGLSDGRMEVYPNKSTGPDPDFGTPFYVQVGEPGSKVELSVGARATFQIVDWNNDGMEDLLVGGLDGKVRLFLNHASSGNFDLRQTSLLQEATGDLTVPTGRASVAVADLDGDGRKDLISGNTEGQIWFYRNVGTDPNPQFHSGQAVQAGGAEINLEGIPRSRPSLADYDGDGLVDLLVGSRDGRIRWYRAESWEPPSGGIPQYGDPGATYEHVFGVLADPWHNTVAASDVNGDAVVSPLDALLIINELGRFRYADNTGRLRNATFAVPPFLDVNDDGFCSPLDALMVINELNAPSERTSRFASNSSLEAADWSDPASPLSVPLGESWGEGREVRGSLERAVSIWNEIGDVDAEASADRALEALYSPNAANAV